MKELRLIIQLYSIKMNYLFALMTAVLVNVGLHAQSKNIYDYSFTDIEGNKVELKQFAGKKILFINVASKCGFTPQYKDLQALHEKYGDKVTLIGFPCNQFLGQEPKGEDEIQAFCQKNYGVEFLMASKIDVKGKDQHPVYEWLTSEELNGVESSKVGWNFQKYLVDENGKLIRHFSPKTNPMDNEITSLIE